MELNESWNHDHSILYQHWVMNADSYCIQLGIHYLGTIIWKDKCGGRVTLGPGPATSSQIIIATAGSILWCFILEGAFVQLPGTNLIIRMTEALFFLFLFDGLTSCICLGPVKTKCKKQQHQNPKTVGRVVS